LRNKDVNIQDNFPHFCRVLPIKSAACHAFISTLGLVLSSAAFLPSNIPHKTLAPHPMKLPCLKSSYQAIVPIHHQSVLQAICLPNIFLTSSFCNIFCTVFSLPYC
jgi:hypothetical protein